MIQSNTNSHTKDIGIKMDKVQKNPLKNNSLDNINSLKTTFQQYPKLNLSDIIALNKELRIVTEKLELIKPEKLLLPRDFKICPESQDNIEIPRPHCNTNIEQKENSSMSIKQDTKLMSIDKINTPETKFLTDFNLNRSAGRFSNLILEIKSTHEKGIRYFKNIINKNKKEELCVKFENGKVKITNGATIARQKLMKKHNEINSTKAISNLVYTAQQQKSDLFNNYKILLDEMIRVESKINKLINRKSKPEEEIHPLYQNHKQFEKINIIDIIDFPTSPNGKIRDINVIFNEMRATIRMLEDEYNSFKRVIEKEEKNKDDKIENTDKTSSFEHSHSSSNVSLSSSGYFSGTADESGYSSEEVENRNTINNVMNQKNHKLENLKLEKTEISHKKTHIVVKQKKKKYQFNNKINQTKASMLRAKHNSKKYQFSLNEGSPEIISNHGKAGTKKLDDMLEKTQEIMHDIGNLTKK